MDTDSAPTATPTPGMDPDALRTAAVQRLHRKRDFLQHLVSYVIVNSLLVTIWLVVALMYGFWFPWPLFPIAGWGIGLALHAWATFGPTSRPFTEDEISREMDRLGDA